MPEQDFAAVYREDSSWLAAYKARSRGAIERSREVLKKPCPDTFLGHKHREFVSLPEKIERSPFRPLVVRLSVLVQSAAPHKVSRPIDESRGEILLRAGQPCRALNPRRRNAGVREASLNLVFYPAAFTYRQVRALYKVVHAAKPDGNADVPKGHTQRRKGVPQSGGQRG